MRSHRYRVAVTQALVAGALASCVELDRPLTDAPPLPDSLGGDPSCPADWVGMRVTPVQSEIEVGDARNIEMQFSALALFSGGAVEPVAAAWAVDPPGAGSIDASGVFVPSGEMGAETVIRATSASQTATARLGLKLVRRVPADPPTSWVTAFGEDRPRREIGDLSWIEPKAGTRLPSNPENVRFTWNGASHGRFRVRFLSAVTEISAYTQTPEFQPDPDTWRWLAASNRGRTVRVELEAADEAAAEVQAAPAALVVGFCHPEELCNQEDDDCDGTFDEACARADPPVGSEEGVRCLER